MFKTFCSDDLIICSDSREYVFLTAVSTTTTQNIKTIGDPYKGPGLITNQPNIFEIGENLLAHRKITHVLK